VRVATFNLLHGRTPEDGVVDADRLRAAVRTIDADVLALQEVDRDQERSAHLDLTAVAAEAMGAADARFLPALSGAPGHWRAARADDPPGTPAYGVALLSRLPVRAWREVRLPALPVPVPFRFRGRRPVLVRDEPRVGLVAELDDGAGPLAVACTHLSFLPGWNLLQLNALSRRLPGRCLLLGDLNLHTAAARRATGLVPLAPGLTFPAHAPDRQIDHVLGRGVRAASPAQVHALPLSDHRALAVDVR
jgi:endonuclease/exonuclease/phosphatase family metal-dependent hydrolase